jgi:hypothetical protein
MMDDQPGAEYDEGLESPEPAEADTDLGDAIKDGTSNTVDGGGPNGP